MPRWSLGLLSFAHSAVFAWAGATLPWRTYTLFSVTSMLLAVLHAAVGALACGAHAGLGRVWRVQCGVSFAYLGFLIWGLVPSSVYLYSLYKSLGPGMVALLTAALLLVVLFTMPLACWGIAKTGGLRPHRRASPMALMLFLAAGAELVFWWTRGANAAVPTPAPNVDDLARQLESALGPLRREAAPETARVPSLYTARPVHCAADIDASRTTLVVTYVPTGESAPVSKCLQTGPSESLRAAARLIHEQAAPGFVKVDVVAATGNASSPSSLGDALAFRPAIDGVCSGKKCLMPWQLVVRDAFVKNQPLKAIPDVRFGVSLSELRKALGDPGEALRRIETQSVVVAPDGSVRPYPGTLQRVSAEELSSAQASAERFIAGAQTESGQFVYRVDPFTGKRSSAELSIARQAGTTLAWCEHASSEDKAAVAESALGLLAGLEQSFGNASVLMASKNARLAHLGASALPLAALLACRPFVGPKYDPMIGRLARLLLRQQRRDGGFLHTLDLATGNPVRGAGTLFADGEAVLALSLLEALGEGQSADFPALAETRDAVERAMTYFGNRYWDTFAGQFFFIAENWHCIAAAASLEHHRNDAYERFCLDYLTFRNRWVFDGASGVRPEYIGGHSIGNIVPPHTTTTSGHGETLTAAIAIKRARGMPIAADIEMLRSVLGFLVRNQWTRENCFACAPRAGIPGAFSEHVASPTIRIDYVQHAWAAIAGGRKELEREE